MLLLICPKEELERIFLDLTGLEEEEIVITPFNQSLCLSDPRPLDPGYKLECVSEETDFKNLNLKNKTLYLKAFRGELHYTLRHPDTREPVVGHIPYDIIHRNFTGGHIKETEL